MGRCHDSMCVYELISALYVMYGEIRINIFVLNVMYLFLPTQQSMSETTKPIQVSSTLKSNRL